MTPNWSRNGNKGQTKADGIHVIALDVSLINSAAMAILLRKNIIIKKRTKNKTPEIIEKASHVSFKLVK